MSIDSSIINLDKKIVVDNYGGRHIHWLVEKFAGDRLIIDHDDNAGLDYFADKAKEHGFKVYGADDFIEYLESSNIIAENELVDNAFYAFRYSLMNSGKNIAIFIQDCEIPLNSHIETGKDEELNLPWFRCSSFMELCRGLLEYDKGMTDLDYGYNGTELLQSFIKTGLTTIDYKTHIFEEVEGENKKDYINIDEINRRNFDTQYNTLRQGDLELLMSIPEFKHYTIDYRYQLEALMKGDKVLPLWNEKWKGRM